MMPLVELPPQPAPSWPTSLRKPDTSDTLKTPLSELPSPKLPAHTPIPGMNKLTDPEIEAAVADLPGWTRDGDALVSDWRFANFDVAFGFMTRIAVESERLDHHPEWSNVYNRVTIRLTTHDKGGITTLDTALAQFVSDTAAVMEPLH